MARFVCVNGNVDMFDAVCEGRERKGNRARGSRERSMKSRCKGLTTT